MSLLNIFRRPKPIDWKARLAADVEQRKRLVGEPYAKRRTAQIIAAEKRA